MSGEILLEMQVLLDAIVCGVILSVGYDVLRIFRRVLKHKIWCVGMEDMTYWIACGVIVFAMILRENSGIIRWYHFAGLGIGAYIYHMTFGRILVKYISLVLNGIINVIKRICEKMKSIVKRIEK